MKINDLDYFRFDIGNTEDGYDVVATNLGLEVNGKIDGDYDDELIKGLMATANDLCIAILRQDESELDGENPRLLHIEWLTNISLAWLAMLWLPFTPEKIITFMIAMVFSRLFFPKDEKTFNMLAELKKKASIKKKPQQ